MALREHIKVKISIIWCYFYIFERESRKFETMAESHEILFI